MTGRGAVPGVLWFLGAVVLTVAGRLVAADHLPAGVVVPVAGLAVVWGLGATTSAGLAATLAALAPAFAVPLLVDGVGPGTAVGHTAGLLVQTLVCVVLVRRWCPDLLGAGGTRSVHDPATLARAILAALAGTLAGGVVVAVGVLLPTGAPVDYLVTPWGASLAGLVTVAAGLHVWWEGPDRWETAPVRRLELTLMAVVATAAYVLVFVQDSLPLAFLLMVFGVWAGSRFSTLVTVTQTVLLAAVAVVLTWRGHGPFGVLDFPEQPLIVQAFVLTSMLAATAVATGREERRRLLAHAAALHREAEDRAEILSAMAEAMEEGLVVLDADGRLVRTNGAARRLLELTDTGFQPRSADYHVYRRDGALLAADEHPSRRAMREGTVPPHDVVLRHRNGSERILHVRADRLTGGGDGEAVGAVVVYRDVTDERRQSDELADFASTAAHDLRSPLHSARAWLELVSQASGSTDPAARAGADTALERAIGSIDRMSGLIGDLLEHAHAENGALDRHEVLLDGEDGLVAEVARELGCEEQVRVEPIDPVVADAALCHQLVANLLGNAVKYVGPGVVPDVVVRGRRRGARVEVTVEDNGLGVPHDDPDRLFDRFYRDPDLAADVAGTGLGLAICRTVVERHGGSISCGRRTDGPGSWFTFDLPAAG